MVRKKREAKLFEDFIGKKVGRLTVVALNKIDEKRQITYLAECDCGNKKLITRHSLMSEFGAKSCGCLFREAVKRNKKMSVTKFYA